MLLASERHRILGFLLVFSVCFLEVVRCTRKERGFVLNAPKHLVAGSTNYLALTLFNVTSDESAEISVQLLTTANNILAEANIVITEENSLIEIAVPPTMETKGNIKITGQLKSSSDYHIDARKEVRIRNDPLIIFLQTDKSIYKTGQTVKFRVLPLDVYLRIPQIAVKGDIWIENPDNVRVAQWKNIDFGDGIVQRELFLSTEPVLGTWRIHCTVNGQKQTRSFEVKKYVLPKFDVKITPPSYVLSTTKTMTWVICAKYTYGKPVEGKLIVQLSYDGKRVLEEEYRISGCYNLTVKMDERVARYKIELKTTVAEDGTGVQRNATNRVDISRSPFLLKFPYAEGRNHFKPGIPYIGKVLVTLPNGQPAVNETVHLCIKEILQSCKSFTSNTDGIVKYVVPPVRKGVKKITLQATIYTTDYPGLVRPQVSMDLTEWYSPSSSYLQIGTDGVERIPCNEHYLVPVLFTDLQDKKEAEINIQVISRGQILLHENLKKSTELIPTEQLYDEEFQLPLDVEILYRDPINYRQTYVGFRTNSKMSPIMRLLVYYIRDDGEVVADTREYKIEHCYENDVSLRFASLQQQPGTYASMLLDASPNSVCGITMVDKSTRLMDSESQMFSEKIFRMVKNYDLTRNSEPHQTKLEHRICEEEISYNNNFWRRRHLPITYRSDYVDAMSAFEEAGMVPISDLLLETRPCKKTSFNIYPVPRTGILDFRPMRGRVYYSTASSQKPKIPPKSAVEVRDHFPETWLWDLVQIGESGNLVTSYELPHTITTWVGSAMCISKQNGFGIDDEAAITAFQPFFLTYSLPFSVIRGEKIPLIITVFNYLSECLPIKLSVDKSDQFKILSESHINLCVCGEKSVTHRFQIRPLKIGDVNITVRGYSQSEMGETTCENRTFSRVRAWDAATRKLKVEAEGFPVEETKNYFICPADNPDGFFQQDINILFPYDLVEDSGRAFISVTGDLMGPSLQNLDGLVRLPMGCGEQNMILFAPNIFVLNYLRVTDQVIPDIEHKALQYMKTGYQRELNYRHDDGSFSAFGKRDASGSMWLTAFVVKSFAQARKYISIDEADLELSTKWILEKQRDDGCFNMTGRIIHADMKGGLETPHLASLTAYVLIALLEAGNIDRQRTEKALACLSSEEDPNVYSLSLFSYAAALAGSLNEAEKYFEKLETKAVKKDNLMFWQTEEGKSSRSLSVEISGYAILALTHLGKTSDLYKALSIVRWITQQRNAKGGFISTQDTVVALQALSNYAIHTKNSDRNLDITILLEGNELEQNLTVNSENRLLTQTVSVPDVPTSIDITANGYGCILLQLSSRYHVRKSTSGEVFNLTVISERSKEFPCNNPIITACVNSRRRETSSSGMVVLEIKMVSGFAPDESSLSQLHMNKNLQLKRHEVVENQVNFYFYELTLEPRCLSFAVEEKLLVEDILPATATVYDYYDPDVMSSTNYTIDRQCHQQKKSILEELIHLL